MVPSHLFPKGVFIMSQHPSFKAGSSSNKKRRNVLKRFERVALLRKRGQWKEGDRVSGLMKTLPEE
jgi:small basic protein (TIGR04137 family)